MDLSLIAVIGLLVLIGLLGNNLQRSADYVMRQVGVLHLASGVGWPRRVKDAGHYVELGRGYSLIIDRLYTLVHWRRLWAHRPRPVNTRFNRVGLGAAPFFGWRDRAPPTLRMRSNGLGGQLRQIERTLPIFELGFQ